MRVGNVFTAWADVLAAALICGFPFSGHLLTVLLIAGCSSCLYLGGMVLNDIADLERDRVLRPARPLPAGLVSLPTARLLAVLLFVGGLVCGWLAGATPGILATVLLLAVVAYDLLLKRTALGPATMGLCRCLNFCLGLAVFPHALWLPTDLSVPLVGRVGTMAAVGLGLYTMSVTRFARREDVGGGRIELATAILGMNLGLLMAGFAALALRTAQAHQPVTGPWPWFPYHVELLQHGEQPMRFLWWIVLIGWVNGVTLPAVLHPSPQRIQAAVRWLLVGIVLYDAAVTGFVRGPLVALWLLPLAALPAILSRWIPAT